MIWNCKELSMSLGWLVQLVHVKVLLQNVIMFTFDMFQGKKTVH